jgi:pantoate--beta-alanine ligase
MRVVRTEADLRDARAALATPVGFVPTMGALHAGHVSLVSRARGECASVVASIYVNPLQFGAGEDLGRYPRTFDADKTVLRASGVDVLFAPDDAVMYPPGSNATIDPGPVADHLEGERRPGHFRGVATVVRKLFDLIAPQRAYFGQKDAQQLAVVRAMTAALDLPVEIVGCPIVREADGLAMSSRNVYLGADERREAVKLSRVLRAIAQALAVGGRDVAAITARAASMLSPLRSDYLAVVDPNAFAPLETAPRGADLLTVGAAYCGTTRLIDNVDVRTP